jgi:hypothetical protein
VPPGAVEFCAAVAGPGVELGRRLPLLSPSPGENTSPVGPGAVPVARPAPLVTLAVSIEPTGVVTPPVGSAAVLFEVIGASPDEPALSVDGLIVSSSVGPTFRIPTEPELST